MLWLPGAASRPFRHYFNLRNLIYAFLCGPCLTQLRRPGQWHGRGFRRVRHFGLHFVADSTMSSCIVRAKFAPNADWLIREICLAVPRPPLWLHRNHITYDFIRVAHKNNNFFLCSCVWLVHCCVTHKSETTTTPKTVDRCVCAIPVSQRSP